MTFPSRENLVICFGHPAYQVKAAFDSLKPGVKSFEVKTFEEFERRIAEADVVVVSGFWKNYLLQKAPRLKFIQSISAGINQYDLGVLKAGGVRLASAQGVNMNAVSDHAMSLILAMLRRLPDARDNQAKKFWRPMQSDPALREDELALMSEAALMGCRLFEHVLTFIRSGLTEIDVAAELEYQARRLGAEAMSFETIVASGIRSALPHGRATSTPLPRRGFLTLDFGIIHGGYCSDMTRTVYLGKPGKKERDAYEAVLEAQEAAVRAVRPGASCREVDEAARSVLRKAGFAEAFSHSTGHGVGLEIHESPRIGAGQKTSLLSGMVITIEPGIYLAGEFGIRIEDMVAVTRTGCQVLTPSPKALIELV